MANILNTADKTVRAHLRIFIENDYIIRDGAKKNEKWIIVKGKEKLIVL